MRRINGSDVFAAVRVIQKSGLKEKLKPALKMASEKGVDINEVGIEGIMTAVFSLAESEKAIWEILAEPFEMTAGDLAKLDIEELCDGLEFLYKDGGLLAFFKRLSGLIG